MAVSTVATPEVYAANGLLTDFVIPWAFESAAHVRVEVADAAGVVSELTQPSGFTVVGNAETGYIARLASAPATGSSVVVFRRQPPLQTTPFNDNARFPAARVAEMGDRFARAIQDIQAQLDTCVRFSFADYGVNFDGLKLPPLDTLVGKLWTITVDPEDGHFVITPTPSVAAVEATAAISDEIITVAAISADVVALANGGVKTAILLLAPAASTIAALGAPGRLDAIDDIAADLGLGASSLIAAAPTAAAAAAAARDVALAAVDDAGDAADLAAAWATNDRGVYPDAANFPAAESARISAQDAAAAQISAAIAQAIIEQYFLGAYADDTAAATAKPSAPVGAFYFKTGEGVRFVQSTGPIVFGGVSPSAVISVAGQTGAVTLDADDIAETASKLWLTSSERAKLSNAATLNALADFTVGLRVSGAPVASEAFATGAANAVATTIASQAEAEAGSNNTNRMTPLRTAQAIAALATAGTTFANVMDYGADPGNAAVDMAGVMAAAHATGKPIWVPRAAGAYHFLTSWKPTDGSRVVVVGEGADLVRFTGADGVVMVYCDRTYGTGNRVTGAYIEGVTFDGLHSRDAAEFPYDAATGTSASQGLNLRASHADTPEYCVVTRCRFENFKGLPVWIADFSGGVEYSYNYHVNTKDVGLLLNDNLKVIGNVSDCSADNGFSISRSNRNVIVTGNTVRNANGSGIFVGGVDNAGSGNLTISGASYAVGATVTVTLASSVFYTEDVGLNVTAENGSDIGLVRIVSLSSASVASAVVLQAIPASLQNAATSTWSKGPISGTQFCVIADNITEGCFDQGIRINQGADGVSIHDNIDHRCGVQCDSETYTSGTALAGGSSITVADITGFSNGDWVVVVPDYTYEGIFIAQINSAPSGNSLPISAGPAVENLINARVYKAQQNTGAYGIVCAGNFLSTTQYEYFQNFAIHHNRIIDPVGGGIKVGTTSGAARFGRISDNDIVMSQTVQSVASPHGIDIDDVNNNGMRTNLIEVKDNFISLNGAGIAISYTPMDTSNSSYIAIGPNRSRQVTTPVSVIEKSGSADITKDYKPIIQTGSLTEVNNIVGDVIALESSATASYASNVLTVTQSLSSYGPGAGGVTINSVDFSAIDKDFPLIIIRNSSGSNNITFTHNSSALRLRDATNYVLGPYEAAMFFPVSTTILQQIIG